MSESDDIEAVNKQDQEIWENYVRDMEVSSDGHEEIEESFEALLEGCEHQDLSGVSEEGVQDVGVVEGAVIAPAQIKKTNGPAQIDKRTGEKLRKGQIRIEARLDLHGLNRTQAHEKLLRFITSCYNQGLRCVLVITGKGISKLTSKDWLTPSKGVLKENVPHWLSEKPLSDIVLKHVFAQPKDGGHGALYVYLKRQR